MDKQIDNKHQTKRQIIVIGFSVVTIMLLVLIIVQLTAPKRSVAAYCQVYKEEKLRLGKLPGSSYPSGVFNDAISDASEYEVSFAKLEKVAPDEINPDVATLQSVYKKMHDDPSQAISASISGAPADTSLKQWTADHCNP